MIVNGYEISPGADLSGAYLSGAYLSGASLRGADLSGADLSGADLSGAILRGADLRDASLSGAILSCADLSGAYLSGASLRGADISVVKGMIDGGQESRGYRFVAVQHEDGWRIAAGCRWLTLDDAVAHWGGDSRPTSPECLERVYMLQQIITMREDDR